MVSVFISYRREGDAGWAGRLAADLRREFPYNDVFLDITSIGIGEDFVDAMRRSLESCAVVIVMIGPRWLNARDEQGQRRLDDPEDWVRLEIEESLKHSGLRVVPLLVGTATMPRAVDLPESLRLLARRNAHEITDRRWDYDVSELVKALKRIGIQSGGLKVGPGLGRSLHKQHDVQASGPRLQDMRFRVALSFPAEHRPYVRAISEELKKTLTRDDIFYDDDFKAELARPSAYLTLMEVYRDQSDLLVVFLCAEYQQKKWCGLEWRVVYDLIMQRQEERIMRFRFDDARIDGLVSVDVALDCGWDTLPPDEAAKLILDRLIAMPPKFPVGVGLRPAG